MHKKIVSALIIAMLASPAIAQQADQEVTGFSSADRQAMEQCTNHARLVESQTQALNDAGQAVPEDMPRSLADCIGVASNICQEQPGGASTIGIVDCLARETAWWDGLLNSHYQDLLATNDPEPADGLRKAQRAWMAFRDADCAFQYSVWGGGSMRSIAGASCTLDHTARRAIDLEALLATH